jgi:hypothetical protein
MKKTKKADAPFEERRAIADIEKGSSSASTTGRAWISWGPAIRPRRIASGHA